MQREIRIGQAITATNKLLSNLGVIKGKKNTGRIEQLTPMATVE